MATLFSDANTKRQMPRVFSGKERKKGAKVENQKSSRLMRRNCADISPKWQLPQSAIEPRSTAETKKSEIHFQSHRQG
jgi:hypothetical protein